MGYIENMKHGTSHENQLKHLNRIEGQIRGVSKMGEEKRYCIDILTQMKAIKSSLASVERQIIDGHMRHCLHDAVREKDQEQVDEMLDEITNLLKMVRS